MKTTGVVNEAAIDSFDVRLAAGLTRGISDGWSILEAFPL